MKPDFDSHKNSMQPSPIDPANSDGKKHQGQFESNTLQRDRFELLSAYLDGEVTAAERKQVEEWLSTDATVQQLHSRLLKLRQGFRSLPVPVPSQPVEATVQQVFARIDRQPKLSLVWSGTAIAALFVGAVTIFSPIGRSPIPEMASQPSIQTPQERPMSSEGLLVALDRPVLSIPKAATVDSKAPDGFDNKSTNSN
ncbi:MAG: Fis family transcriptional regulator [Leptolyngbyaceae cyanobacterium CSU_1_3]|nr:Fis family transcriptional regulator [Leptolyngbyaceae cyanobacterium CSU_1_3]